MSSSDAGHSLKAADWFGQPRGLTILFLTDMWEQFSFYGMRALLVYYMIKQLLIPQQQASLIYGLYAACVFLTPLIGGAIADRWLGRKTAVVLGGLIMACGHFVMAFEPLFYPALIMIASGNGLFMPSLPGQIDGLYSHDDPRRRSAYNVYYVGINLGAFLAPLVAGTIGEIYGWHWGFGVAGIGMVIGLLTYLAGGRYLPVDERTVRRAKPERDVSTATSEGWTRKAVFDRFVLLLSIAACVVVFRGAYEQIGNTVALWLDQGVDRSVSARWAVPLTWFQALNPLEVFLFSPVLISLWTRRAAVNKEPSSIVKMWTGAILVACSYGLLALVAWWSSAHGVRSRWLWLMVFFVVMTIGELHILPVGLGLFGRLAPHSFSATTIATWYLAGFFGNLLAGWLGGFWSDIGHGLFFSLVAALALGGGLLLLTLRRWAGRVEAQA